VYYYHQTAQSSYSTYQQVVHALSQIGFVDDRTPKRRESFANSLTLLELILAIKAVFPAVLVVPICYDLDKVSKRRNTVLASGKEIQETRSVESTNLERHHIDCT
jgi:hypothetical protein